MSNKTILIVDDDPDVRLGLHIRRYVSPACAFKLTIPFSVAGAISK